jgi:dGTPase
LRELKPKTATDIRSAGKPMASFSKEMTLELNALRAFLRTNMYRHTQVNRMTSKAKRIVSDLFEVFIAEPQSLPAEWRKLAEESKEMKIYRIVGDYIAGMTDRYAMLEHQRLFEINSLSL